MESGETPTSELWLEIDLTQVGTEVAVTARGGLQMESSEPSSFSMEVARQFAAWVKRAAKTGTALSGPTAKESAPPTPAQQLQEALFRPGVREVLHKLQGAAHDRRLLLKVNPRSPELKAIPWEALLLPGSASEFLGTSPELLLARGVSSILAWQKREVRGAVRLLAISPEDPDAPGRLKSLLSESLASGELEWLEPLVGSKASKAAVENRLRQEPVPHILHFIGHGSMENGSPTLQMATGSEQEPGYRVNLLAGELRNLFRHQLRLIVLESCQGAQPGALLSAAEELAQGAAGAVIAHLWEVKADVARRCSAAFYRTLTGRSEHAGDVAHSLHDARRSILNALEGSAEAFSPVLYLRGRQPVLFDFSHRKVVPPRPLPSSLSAVPEDPAVRPLLELIQKPFSLVLGDHLLDDAWTTAEEDFRKQLHGELRPPPRAAPEHLPVSALAQRYALQFSADQLRDAFQDLTRSPLPEVPLVEKLARRLSPGFHLTLLRLPALEQALTKHRPELVLYVIWPLPGDPETPTILRYARGQDWRRLPELPLSFDPSRDVALLRLYRGHKPNADLHEPLLTEDDHLLGVRDLRDMLPSDLAAKIQSQLKNQPAVLVGMSLESWEHRHVLHSLFDRDSLPAGSRVVVEPGAAEVGWWKKGRALPGDRRERGVSVVPVKCAELARRLDAPEPEGAR
ncbi:CHAT domain-containing protein [Hyalangium versicolor]|uniref:CHAT domain-containing protein n=1 Tax=Hyalangium versicolor TaxID=2861190 RepID=UPI001CCCB5F6|nr:CHAT domain-containing protein [Hyalangium versicolor]